MKILVPAMRVIRTNSDGSGVELANVKMSMNPFDKIAVGEALRQKDAGKATEIVIADRGILIKTDALVEPLAPETMILAEVRSDLASASPTKEETPGSPAATTGSIADLAGRAAAQRQVREQFVARGHHDRVSYSVAELCGLVQPFRVEDETVGRLRKPRLASRQRLGLRAIVGLGIHQGNFLGCKRQRRSSTAASGRRSPAALPKFGRSSTRVRRFEPFSRRIMRHYLTNRGFRLAEAIREKLAEPRSAGKRISKGG